MVPKVIDIRPTTSPNALTFTNFLRSNRRWLGAGFLLALSSSFGQTYFISLFGGDIRASFDLSHGQFGWIYSAMNIASAVTLIWLGKLADRKGLALLSAATLCGLAAATLAMSAAGSLVVLAGALFGLRLFGQGMLGHIAMTAMARWFTAQRGRALSIAALGFPAGEAVLPFTAVALIAAIGWRSTWVVAAAVLICLALPLCVLLLRREPDSGAAEAGDEAAGQQLAAPRHWTRRQVLRDPFFYGLLPGIMAPSFMITGAFFHQVHLVETKGWSLAWFAASFPAYSLAAVAGSLGFGWAVDRWNAVRLLSSYLLPMAAGFLVLALGATPAAAPVFMALLGGTAGAGATIVGALWAELYGTRHLGAIRALAMAVLVFAAALAPGTMGWLIDRGVGIETQFLWFAGYTLCAAGAMWPLTIRLRRTVAAQD